MSFENVENVLMNDSFFSENNEHFKNNNDK